MVFGGCSMTSWSTSTRVRRTVSRAVAITVDVTRSGRCRFDLHSCRRPRRRRTGRRTVAEDVGGEIDLLVSAVALHDIGKAPELHVHGFWPLDGATYLDREGAPRRLTNLVANFSGSGVEARLRGFEDAYRDLPDERTAVRDALWYCCLTSGPRGERFTLADRLREVEATVARTEQRLTEAARR